jgi:hypothetical protein
VIPHKTVASLDGQKGCRSPDARQEFPSLGLDAICAVTKPITATAVFGQVFLNRGIYGDTRILSPVTVAEMARNQIREISGRFVDEYFPEAGTGLPSSSVRTRGWSLMERRCNQRRPFVKVASVGSFYGWIQSTRSWAVIFRLISAKSPLRKHTVVGVPTYSSTR